MSDMLYNSFRFTAANSARSDPHHTTKSRLLAY